MRTLRLNRTCGVWFRLQALIYKAPQKEPLWGRFSAAKRLGSVSLRPGSMKQQQQSPPPRVLCVTRAPPEGPQDTPGEPCSGPLEWGAHRQGIARAGLGRGGVETGVRRCPSEHLEVWKRQLPGELPIARSPRDPGLIIRNRQVPGTLARTLGMAKGRGTRQKRSLGDPLQNGMWFIFPVELSMNRGSPDSFRQPKRASRRFPGPHTDPCIPRWKACLGVIGGHQRPSSLAEL